MERFSYFIYDKGVIFHHSYITGLQKDQERYRRSYEEDIQGRFYNQSIQAIKVYGSNCILFPKSIRCFDNLATFSLNRHFIRNVQFDDGLKLKST